MNAPRTPNECVNTMLFEYDSLREDGADARSALTITSNRFDVPSEQVAHFLSLREQARRGIGSELAARLLHTRGAIPSA